MHAVNIQLELGTLCNPPRQVQTRKPPTGCPGRSHQRRFLPFAPPFLPCACPFFLRTPPPPAGPPDTGRRRVSRAAPCLQQRADIAPARAAGWPERPEAGGCSLAQAPPARHQHPRGAAAAAAQCPSTPASCPPLNLPPPLPPLPPGTPPTRFMAPSSAFCCLLPFLASSRSRSRSRSRPPRPCAPRCDGLRSTAAAAAAAGAYQAARGAGGRAQAWRPQAPG
jgi:hypothetical protein